MDTESGEADDERAPREAWSQGYGAPAPKAWVEEQRRGYPLAQRVGRGCIGARMPANFWDGTLNLARRF